MDIYSNQTHVLIFNVDERKKSNLFSSSIRMPSNQMTLMYLLFGHKILLCDENLSKLKNSNAIRILKAEYDAFSIHMT